MRNAEWFRNKQMELRKQNEAQLKRQRVVEEQWIRIINYLNNFEVKEDTEFIPIWKAIFDENLDKLEDMGFNVEKGKNCDKLYFCDYKETNSSESIYNLKDGKHNNSTKDYVYKISDEKAETPKKETIKEEPKIAFKYLKDGKLKECTNDEELYKELKKIFNLF